MLVLKNIVKDYINNKGVLMQRALDGVDVTINDGDFLSIIGPSGSGKSTLMNIIGLLDEPTLGDYILDGEKLENLTEDQKAQIRGKKIGFVFQGYNLIPRMSVLEQVMLPLSYEGFPAEEKREKALKALEKVGLSAKIESKPNELSGGQQQRVAIARAIVTNPTLILADEPTGALDSKTGREVLEIFGSLNQEGKTVVLITHDIDIAGYATHTIHIKDGKIDKIQKNNKAAKAKPASEA